MLWRSTGTRKCSTLSLTSHCLLTSVLLLAVVQEGVQLWRGVRVGGSEGVARGGRQGGGHQEGEVRVVRVERVEGRLGGVQLGQLRVHSSTSSTSTTSSSTSSVFGHDGRLVVRSWPVGGDDGGVVTGGRHHHPQPQLVQLSRAPGPGEPLRAPHHGGEVLGGKDGWRRSQVRQGQEIEILT